MNSISKLPIVASAVAAVLVCRAIAGASDSAQGSYAGWIDEIKGSASLTKPSNGRRRPLDPAKDRYLKIHVGENLHCEQGCYLRIVLKDGRKVELNDSFQSIDVPALHASKVFELRTSALESYAIRGGGDRNSRAAGIVWPADGSVMGPEDAVLRWIPRKGSISLAIEDDDGKTLWRQDDVNAELGELTSLEARKALRKYRDQGTAKALHFSLIDPGVRTYASAFTVALSAPAKKDLEQELHMWEGETGFTRTVCRAYSFVTRGMLVEAAREYDAALATAPSSTDLLLATIEALEFIGDFKRAGQLRKRLPPGTDFSG